MTFNVAEMIEIDADQWVNRGEPWIQTYYVGQLYPQDIKDAKLPPAPPGAIEARECFGQRIKRTGSAREDFVSERSEHLRTRWAVRRSGRDPSIESPCCKPQDERDGSQ
jgi:hypothetical protein